MEDMALPSNCTFFSYGTLTLLLYYGILFLQTRSELSEIQNVHGLKLSIVEKRYHPLTRAIAKSAIRINPSFNSKL